METTTLTIHVRENTRIILEEEAKSNGKDFVEYVEDLLDKAAKRPKTLDKILAPLRQNFAESGMTEEDLDELIESERQAMWEEKHAKAKR